jgi:hypothetical protein
LAARVADLLEDAGLRSRFGAAGRAKVEREFDIRAEAAWLCEVLTDALSGRVAPVRRDVPVVQTAGADKPRPLLASSA